MIPMSPNAFTFLGLGDTHGNNRWLSDVILKYADRAGTDTIIQFGDFGYWEHTKEGKAFLDKTSKKLVSTGRVLYFVDGNHENHPLLWKSYPPGSDGFCEVRENLFYIPRGHRWVWNGIRFLALGGAYSVDSNWRIQQEAIWDKPGTLYWPTETITDEQVEKAIQGGPVDVMICHDTPEGADISQIYSFGLALGSTKDDLMSRFNREKVRRVVVETRPKVLFHGHYHFRVSCDVEYPIGEKDGALEWGSTRVEGLSWDGDPQVYNSWARITVTTDESTVERSFSGREFRQQ